MCVYIYTHAYVHIHGWSWCEVLTWAKRAPLALLLKFVTAKIPRSQAEIGDGKTEILLQVMP